MNIVHLLNFAGANGSEKYVRTLFLRQLAEAHHVTLVYNIDGPLVEDAKKAGADTVQLSMRSPLDLAAGKKLAAICVQKGAEVVHTHFPRENCIALLAKRRLPALRVINTSHLVFSTGLVWRVLNRYFSPKNAAVLCVCNAQLRALEANGVCAERLHVVHNGIEPVDPDALREQYRRSVREEFGIDGAAPLIVTLGRFVPIKGLDILLRATEKVHAAVPEARLIMAGTGEELDAMRAQIRDLGLENVIFTPGFRSDTQALLAASDIYVNSSRSEALSFSILEAMMMGLVPVISDVGGNADIVDKESPWGLQFPSEDADALASALIDLLGDPARMRDMGKKARARAMEAFTEDKMYSETMSYYKE